MDRRWKNCDEMLVMSKTERKIESYRSTLVMQKKLTEAGGEELASILRLEED